MLVVLLFFSKEQVSINTSTFSVAVVVNEISIFRLYVPSQADIHPKNAKSKAKQGGTPRRRYPNWGFLR